VIQRRERLSEALSFGGDPGALLGAQPGLLPAEAEKLQPAADPLGAIVPGGAGVGA